MNLKRRENFLQFPPFVGSLAH